MSTIPAPRLDSPVSVADLRLTGSMAPKGLTSAASTGKISLVSRVEFSPFDAPPPTQNVGLYSEEATGAPNYIALSQNDDFDLYDVDDVIHKVAAVPHPTGADGKGFPAWDKDGNPSDIPLVVVGSEDATVFPSLTAQPTDYADEANPDKVFNFFKPPAAPPPAGYPVVVVVAGSLGKFEQTAVPSHITASAGLPFVLYQSGYALAWMQYTAASHPAPEVEVQHLIQLLRERAATYQIDPSRIALYGRREGATVASDTVLDLDRKLLSGETYPEELQSSRVDAAILEEGVYDWQLLDEAVTGAHFGGTTLADVAEPTETAASTKKHVTDHPGISIGTPMYLINKGAIGTPPLAAMDDAKQEFDLATALLADDPGHATVSKITTGAGVDLPLTYIAAAAWLTTHV